MLDGFTYRGQHSSALGLTLLSYKVHSPELREYEDSVAGLNGAIDYGTEFGKREIEVRVGVLSTDEPLKARASKIMRWLDPTRGYGDLAFDELPEWTYSAKFTGKISIDQIARYGEFGITFKCVDPFAHEEATDTPTLKYDTGLTYDSGLTYPNETSFAINGSIRLQMYMQNRGYADVYPVVTYTGSGSNPRLTINGKTVSTASALSPGFTWVVDTLNGRVTVNGVLVAMTSADFAPIPPDGCECVFEIDSGSGTLEWEYGFLHL